MINDKWKNKEGYMVYPTSGSADLAMDRFLAQKSGPLHVFL